MRGNAATKLSNSRSYALMCVMTLLACVIAAYPVAEIGMVDDWSYVQSVRVLAQTGHIVYNGWATAMLGWQLYLGALFVKLFGPSFTSVRASMLPVALATAFLTQRVMVRSGINSRNASLGTLTLMLSPLCLPLVFSFMTDIGGLFCIVLCLYACLRALQAQSDRAMLAWLTFAALSNAVGGTARQIAWLGVLVIVPSTVWLLRHRSLAVQVGAGLYTVSVAFIFGSMHWFKGQTYSVPESLLPEHFGIQNILRLGLVFSVLFVTAGLFLLPILIAFVPEIQWRNRRTRDFLIVGGVLCLVIGFYLAVFHQNSFGALIAPYTGTYVTQCGLVDGTPIKGSRPIVLSFGIRMLFTLFVLFVLNCFFAFLRFSRLSIPKQRPPEAPSRSTLLILLVPFLLAYFGLLAPRALIGQVFDRYLLPILLVGLILLLRLYQDRVRPKLPRISLALLALYAVFAVAGTHDAFSLYRAKAAAIQELRDSGVPDSSIDGGMEWNAMAQIARTGYVNDPRIRVPANAFVQHVSTFPLNCQPDGILRTPELESGYALSFDAHACGGVSSFAPVTYADWLRARAVHIYIVQTGVSTSRSN